jgi:hypothetical protein
MRKMVAILVVCALLFSVAGVLTVSSKHDAVSSEPGKPSEASKSSKADARVPTRLTLRASPITALSCVKRLVCLTRLTDNHGRGLYHKPVYLYRVGCGPIATGYTDSCGSAVFYMPCAMGPANCWSYWYYAEFRGDIGYNSARSNSERPVWLG